MPVDEVFGDGPPTYDPPYDGECQDCDHFEKLMHDGSWTGFGECTLHVSMNYFNDYGYPIARTPIVFKDSSCPAGVTTE